MHQYFKKVSQIVQNWIESVRNELIQSGSDAVGSPTLHLRVAIRFNNFWLNCGLDEVPINNKRSGIEYTQRSTDIFT